MSVPWSRRRSTQPQSVTRAPSWFFLSSPSAWERIVVRKELSSTWDTGSLPLSVRFFFATRDRKGPRKAPYLTVRETWFKESRVVRSRERDLRKRRVPGRGRAVRLGLLGGRFDRFGVFSMRGPSSGARLVLTAGWPGPSQYRAALTPRPFVSGDGDLRGGTGLDVSEDDPGDLLRSVRPRDPPRPASEPRSRLLVPREERGRASGLGGSPGEDRRTAVHGVARVRALLAGGRFVEDEGLPESQALARREA